MHKGARPDLRGGRGVTRVPTVTRKRIPLTRDSLKGFIRLKNLASDVIHYGALIAHFSIVT